MKKKLPIAVVTTVFILLSCFAYSQSGGVSISPSGAAPDPSAALDVQYNNKGTLITRLSNTQRDSISNPATGLMIYNTTTNCINIWVATTWKQMCPTCDFGDPVAGNNGLVCPGDTLTLTATSIEGATYNWTGPNGFTRNEQNPSIAGFTASDTGTYSVVATVSGCSSNPQHTAPYLKAVPQSPSASSNGPLCPGDTLKLTASTLAGATYNWTGPNGFTATQQNPFLSNFLASDTGTYSAVAIVNGCSSSAQTTSVSLATPASPVAGNNGPLFTGDMLNLTASSIPGASYLWSGPNGFASTQQNPSITNFVNSDSGSYTVVAQVNGCSSNSQNTIVSLLTPLATGSTITYSGGYFIHTFTSSDNFIPDSNLNVNVLVVAGGGGGGGGGNGEGAGGGGAGGLIYQTGFAVTANSSYPVTVGAGGSGNNSESNGSQGGNSVFSSFTAIGGGGGGGGATGTGAMSGGSGGGGGLAGTNGASGTAGQGNAGGNFNGDNEYEGGGGGGAGANGSDGVTNNGNGGNGLQLSISGTPTYYAGGGGGGCLRCPYNSPQSSTGGLGGGGNGGSANSNASSGYVGLGSGPGSNGTPNTGGGGGGGAYESPGGNGGSGIVIISYQP